MKLRATGLSAEGATERVEAALRSAAGVFSAVANASSQCIEVDFEDDEVGVDEVIAIIRSAGIEARLAG